MGDLVTRGSVSVVSGAIGAEGNSKNCSGGMMHRSFKVARTLVPSPFFHCDYVS
jgi:hypothetical protein